MSEEADATGASARPWDRIRRAGGAARRALTPSTPAWTAAAWAMAVLWALVLLDFMLLEVAPRFSLVKAAGILVFFGFLALISTGVFVLFWLVGALKARHRWTLLLALPPLGIVALFGWGPKGFAVAGVLALAASLTAGAVAALFRPGARKAQRIVAGVALAVGAGLLGALAYGFFKAPDDPNPALAAYRLQGQTLPLADPGRPGPYKVRTLTYGSGKDRHRPEYAGDADFTAPSVDASKLDEEWKGLRGKARTAYWGFDPKAFPLQGRIWAPQGAGPFPLVLMVHGNHAMEDFSDTGYAYLGELLASQGFIAVSVDENFVNLSMADFINPIKRRDGAENDARAWLLLEHLAQWRKWTADPKHPLHGLADMDRIGLIGHSRGGEAVATAAAFNRLSAYPDDAALKFDYGFDIRGVAAIAPVDGQYEARHRPTPMTDTNYFVIQGSMDGDMTSFMGAAQYARARFPESPAGFKASLYVKDANHGQFNTGWGRNDYGGAVGFLLDETPILDPEAQRRIAKVYLAAFMRAALRDEAGYRDLLRDPRKGAAWLPDVYLAANYADAPTDWLATFEEDLDPGSGSRPGVSIAGRGLSVWREDYPELKYANLDTHQVLLAWDDRVRKGRPSYRIALAAPPAADPAGDLVFALSQSTVSTLPKGFKPPKDRKAGTAKPTPLDWTVVLTDVAGHEARLSLSRDQVLYPQIAGQTRRLSMMQTEPTSEIVMRGYRLPLAAFVAANPALDLNSLTEIRFDFDRSPRGAVMLDDVGLTRTTASP